MRRSDLVLVLLATVGGVACFTNLGRLWPLVDGDLFAHRRDPGAAELAVVSACGLDLARDLRGARLRVEEPALDWLQAAFGRDGADRRLADGLPAVFVRATWKRPGDADGLTIALHPDGRVLGWNRGVQEDVAGPSLEPEAAEAIARAELRQRLGLDDGAYAVTQRAQLERPARRDHQLAFERRWSETPELRERIEVVVAGDRVMKAMRAVVVPAAFERATRAAKAPVEGLQALGLAGLAAGSLAALAVTLMRLRRDEVRLGACAALTGGIALLLLVADAGQQAALHELWDPLWPRAVAFAKLLVDWHVDDIGALVAVFAFLAAGDALDRGRGGARGRSLWAFARGRWGDAGVVAASWRGFLLGLVCGGVLTAAVVLMTRLIGAETALQPRGFFFYPLNSAWPLATTLCFFGYVASLEELGYRWFAGAWLERLTGRRWLAVVVPAAIYGLMHSTMTFLPPASPPGARPLALALVGCCWGVAFFRYDALTVILSHLACDLFIFTWPMLASAEPARVATALAVVAAPLAPALVGGIARALRGRQQTLL